MTRAVAARIVAWVIAVLMVAVLMELAYRLGTKEECERKTNVTLAN